MDIPETGAIPCWSKIPLGTGTVPDSPRTEKRCCSGRKNRTPCWKRWTSSLSEKQVERSNQTLLRRNATLRWGNPFSRFMVGGGGKKNPKCSSRVPSRLPALKVLNADFSSSERFYSLRPDDVDKGERSFRDTARRKTPKHTHNNAAGMRTSACASFEYPEIGRFVVFKGEKQNLRIFIYSQQMEYSRNGIPSTSFSIYGSSCERGGPCWEIHPAHHQDWPTAAWRYVRQQTHQAVVKTEELG